MQAMHRTTADSMLRSTQPRALFSHVSAAPKQQLRSSRGSRVCRATPPEQQQQSSAGSSQPGNVQLNEGARYILLCCSTHRCSSRCAFNAYVAATGRILTSTAPSWTPHKRPTCPSLHVVRQSHQASPFSLPFTPCVCVLCRHAGPATFRSGRGSPPQEGALCAAATTAGER